MFSLLRQQNTLTLSIIFLTIFNGLLLGVYVKDKDVISVARYPEVYTTNYQDMGFGELAAYFADLAQKKGGAHAFEVLKRAPTAPNIDMHLLGHVVGDELYKQEGLDGMKICTNDFRNACSHSIVVGAFLARGEAVLDDINTACQGAPGGRGAYPMCFHGFGHGVLAFAEYELPDAISLCSRSGLPNITILNIVNVSAALLWK